MASMGPIRGPRASSELRPNDNASRTRNLSASVRQELGDGWTLRLGPLTHGAAWAAIEAFLGPPG